MAVTDRASSQHGISAFILEKGVPGFRAGKKENKLGMRASDTGEVIFTDCRVPESQMLGKQGEGFVDSLRILDGGRISIAALSVGTAQGAYEAALKYSQAAQAVRPADFRVSGHPVQAGRHGHRDRRRAAAHLSRRLDEGPGPARDQGIAMAKLFASEIAVRVANEAVQIHGGYGFIKDYPVEKFYRDVKLCTIGEGTSEIQRLVIARQLLKISDNLVLMDDWGAKNPRGRSCARWPAPPRPSRTGGPKRETLLKELFPHTGTRARHRHHRRARRGQEHAGGSLWLATARAKANRSASSRSIRPAPIPAARSWAIASACCSITPIPGVFIRSMATRGWLGGLAAATTDMAVLLDAAGKDVVLIETVGVGQDEVEIAQLADVTVVVLVPGMGDDVQAIKAGIMEIADVFVINKSDQPGADRLEREIKSYSESVDSKGRLDSADCPDRGD